MLLASRVASTLSFCEVPSVDLRVEASMVFVVRGLNDDLLDLKLLPYLLGFRVGILTSDVAVQSVFCVSLERPFVGTGYSLVGRER